MAYIDLNMVRAGVVRHPRDWEAAGYHEIQRARETYRIVDRVALAGLLAVAADRLAQLRQLRAIFRGPMGNCSMTA